MKDNNMVKGEGTNLGLISVEKNCLTFLASLNPGKEGETFLPSCSLDPCPSQEERRTGRQAGHLLGLWLSYSLNAH